VSSKDVTIRIQTGRGKRSRTAEGNEGEAERRNNDKWFAELNVMVLLQVVLLLLTVLLIFAMFAWIISHQPTVLFSQNKPATSNQPEPASSTLLSEQTSTSHQPPANRTT
jgi:cytoskeletal protein RodZ